ncbi:putative maltokinase, partial [Marinilabilia sp.]
GTPIVYYGDEIGMGDNFYLGDRDGVRTPMQWSADKNAGFSSAEPQRLFLPVIFNHDFHYESINVENQEKNASSLLWWMRRVIAKRKQYPAFSRGDIQFIDGKNSKVLAFVRKYEDQVILVVVNLSRYSQQVQLDLSDFKGYVPTEVFSRNQLAPVGEDLYHFPMQFKNYFWFELQHPEIEKEKELAYKHKLEFTTAQWNQLANNIPKSLYGFLSEFAQRSRWFRGKSRKIKEVAILDVIPVSAGKLNSYVLILEVFYIEGKNERYFVPVSVVVGEELYEIKHDHPEAVIAHIEIDGHAGLIYGGSYNKEVRDQYMRLIVQRGKIKGRNGELAGLPARKLNARLKKTDLPLNSKVLGVEQSNTSVLYDKRFFFKMYRCPEEGSNPELDIIKALTENTTFRNFPIYAGALEYRRDEEKMEVGLLVDFLPNESNAWEFTQNGIEDYFDRIKRQQPNIQDFIGDRDNDPKIIEKEKELFDPFYVEMIGLLGKRTAEMHMALASIKEKDFKEEPFSLLYQKSLYQSFRTLIKRTIDEMRSAYGNLEEDQKTLLDDIFENEGLLLSTIKQTLEQKKIHTSKIRIHGDYHLGQVLYTGKDFQIIDFEGEPTRSLTARSLKYCPFKDVAGMLRSFHYAIYMGLLDYDEKQPGYYDYLEPWQEVWYRKIENTFLGSYLETAEGASFIPKEKRQLDDLLSVYTIEKAVYEADYELNNRPDWLHIPLNGLKKILQNLLEKQ